VGVSATAGVAASSSASFSSNGITS